MNAGAVSVVQSPSSHRHVTTEAVPMPPVVTSTSSTLPIARCRGATPPRRVEPYYNDVASPGTVCVNLLFTKNDSIGDYDFVEVHLLAYLIEYFAKFTCLTIAVTSPSYSKLLLKIMHNPVFVYEVTYCEIISAD